MSKDLHELRPSNEEAKRITEECLLGALLRLVRKKPFEKISICELVKLAGVSRTAFYRHYSTIEDIIKGPVVEILDALTLSIGEEKYRQDPPTWYFDLFSYLENYKEVLETVFIITRGEFMKIDLLDDIFSPLSTGVEGEYDLGAFQGAFRFVISKWIGDNFIAEPEYLAEKCLQIQKAFNIVFKA